eukprot:gnl/MRDRNA2_/MRDRNA2_55982_c0_seq1.p1 gnl/MRDRNA2_/MRDRNA2_55982_c0~~gnl/MRDRNA2_/MRDRNA2_55982_c0_seq1.p1  ORF type:complete len:233 (-),score=42.52 gnl/MRDRNA2_/MRDRNA2_55982_c0_seq1:96-794(-)
MGNWQCLICGAASSKIKLTYLDVKGFAEPIRLALFIGGLDFEDCRIDYPAVKALREAGGSPWGQVPVLEVNGKSFGQSQALLRWAGRQTGLYPDDVALQCDAVLNAMSDIFNVMTPAWYGAAIPGRHPITAEFLVPLTVQQKEGVVQALNEHILPGRLEFMEKFLISSGGPWFCGKKLTICDLAFYSFATELLENKGPKGIDSGVIGKFPGLSALVKRLSEHPKVKKWNETH